MCLLEVIPRRGMNCSQYVILDVLGPVADRPSSKPLTYTGRSSYRDVMQHCRDLVAKKKIICENQLVNFEFRSLE